LSSNDPHDSTLVRLGWSSFFHEALAALRDETLAPARVAEEHRDAYVVFAGADELRADVAGRLRHDARGRAALPAVGDWVAVDARRSEGRATIRHVLPRRGALVRKAAGTTTDAQVVAANLDVVFVVASANQDFNAARLARYLAAVWESGAQPVVLVAKADVCEDVDDVVDEAAAVALGADVHAVSSVDGRGLEDVASHLDAGRTAAFVGSSGVGKSTLINRLLGEERLATLPVRDHDDTGRHTTTRRQLIALPSGALVVDTPGMREFGLLDADDGLAAAFADVEEFARSCRFRDCRHASEPGCAVLAAVESRALPQDRLDQWIALGRELAFQRRKEDVRAMLEERRRWKAVSKAARARAKFLGEKRAGSD
jgi:ribosome biogenesis GTPase